MKKFLIFTTGMVFGFSAMAQTTKTKAAQTIDSVKAVQTQEQREGQVSPTVIPTTSLPLQSQSNSAVTDDNRIKDHVHLTNGNSTDTNDRIHNGTVPTTATPGVPRATVRKKTTVKLPSPDSTYTKTNGRISP